MLGAKLLLAKEHLHDKPCQRCGLAYNHKKRKRCPHCHGLDNNALQDLIERKNSTLESNKTLGIVFAIIALVLISAMVAYSNV